MNLHTQQPPCGPVPQTSWRGAWKRLRFNRMHPRVADRGRARKWSGLTDGERFWSTGVIRNQTGVKTGQKPRRGPTPQAKVYQVVPMAEWHLVREEILDRKWSRRKKRKERRYVRARDNDEMQDKRWTYWISFHLTKIEFDFFLRPHPKGKHPSPFPRGPSERSTRCWDSSPLKGPHPLAHPMGPTRDL